MNISRATCTAFNQDNTCCAVASRNGFEIYNLEPWARTYKHDEGGAYKIVRMLFSTSLIAIVGLGDQPSLSPRRLQIYNTKRRSMICELTFPTSILDLHMNRKRLAVVLERQLYLYDISNMRLLHTIETSQNSAGVCALSPNAEQSLLVYPALAANHFSGGAAHAPPGQPQDRQSAATGDVLVYDTLTCQPINVLEAHRAALSVLQINCDGNLLATASEKGTIIRIFSLPDGQRLWELRRGSLPAKISCINFDRQSDHVVVASNSETVHIFRLQKADDGTSAQTPAAAASLDGRPGAPRRVSRGAMGLIRRSSQTLGKSVAGTFAPFLPASMSDMWQPARHFAAVKLPAKSECTIAALLDDSSQVVVLTDAGRLHRYAIDKELGGDCELVHSEDLIPA